MSNAHLGATGEIVTGEKLSLVNVSSCAVGHLSRGCSLEQKRRSAHLNLSPQEVDELHQAQREADIAALQSLRQLAQSAVGKGRSLGIVSGEFRHRDYDPAEARCGLVGHEVYVSGMRSDSSEGLIVLGIPSLTEQADIPYLTLKPMGGMDTIVIPLETPPGADDMYLDFDMLGPTGRRDLRDTVTAFRDIAYDRGV